MQQGETNDVGQIVTYHPMCTFCHDHLYDLEAFKEHMNRKHQYCELCRNDHPHRYYQSLDNLQGHYEKTHYVCKHEDCQVNLLAVFKTPEELDYHIDRQHRGVKKSLDHLIGVSLEMEGSLADKYKRIDKGIQIRDKEGKDFTYIVFF